jgi:hypothetical protein
LCAALIGLGAAFSSMGTAKAAVIEYTAPCVFGCSNIGLNAGDTVSASFGVADSAIAAFAALDLSDVTSFSGLFGTLAFDLDDLSAFWLLLDESATTAIGGLASFGNGSASGSIAGIGAANGFSVSPGRFQIAGGFFGDVTVTVTSVPEPATLALLAVGLVFVGLRHRPLVAIVSRAR